MAKYLPKKNKVPAQGAANQALKRYRKRIYWQAGLALLTVILTITIVFAMTAAIVVTVSSPMETVLMPLLTGDLFGMASYHKVLGIFTAMNSLGLCLGSPLGDLYYDLFGTYRPCFWFFTVLLTAIAVAYRFVIRAAYRDKEALLQNSL